MLIHRSYIFWTSFIDFWILCSISFETSFVKRLSFITCLWSLKCNSAKVPSRNKWISNFVFVVFSVKTFIFRCNLWISYVISWFDQLIHETCSKGSLSIGIIPKSAFELANHSSLESDSPSLQARIVIIWIKERYMSSLTRKFLKNFSRE